jgi:nucleoside 2-deoxyribosyltransferase
MSRRAKVFLSHKASDAKLAQRIAKALEQAGVSVWDSSRMRLGSASNASLMQEARRADAMVIIIGSVDDPVSAWGQYEIGLFWGQSKPVIVLAANTVPAASLPVELVSERRHSFDPANPEQAARRIADDLLAAA